MNKNYGALVMQVQYEENPILTKAEQETKDILALEGIELNAYNIYLLRLTKEGTISRTQAGLAAISFEIDDIRKY